MKKPPRVINVTCSKCTTPLLALRQQPDGTGKLTSFGVKILTHPIGPYIAVCPKCGTHEPFDRRLLG